MPPKKNPLTQSQVDGFNESEWEIIQVKPEDFKENQGQRLTEKEAEHFGQKQPFTPKPKKRKLEKKEDSYEDFDFTNSLLEDIFELPPDCSPERGARLCLDRIQKLLWESPVSDLIDELDDKDDLNLALINVDTAIQRLVKPLLKLENARLKDLRDKLKTPPDEENSTQPLSP